MSAIITSILSSTLKVFIKDYNKQQLNFKLFGEINEQVIHEILHFPATLEIKAIKCESLKIKVPWTNLKHEPITMNMSGLDIDIRECFEPVQQKPGKHGLSRSSKSKKGSKSSGSSSDKADSAQKEKDIGFVKKLFEDISINVKDLRGHISFLSSDRLSDGPEVSFNLAMFVLRSTNSEWKVVDLAKIHVIPKGSPNYILYKEILLGSIVFSAKDPYHDYTDFIKTQPITIRNIITHPIRKLKPVEINTTIEVKRGDITIDKTCVNSVISSLNSLLWCFQNSKLYSSREGQNAIDKSNDTDTDSDDSDDEDLENLIKDKLYGQKQLQQQDFKKQPDFPEIDEGMLDVNDDYINSLEEEFDKLESEAKDLSFSPSSQQGAGQSNGGSVIPHIKMVFTCDTLAVSFKEVANIDLKQIQIGATVEPEPTQTKHGKQKAVGSVSLEGGSMTSSLDSALQDINGFLVVMQQPNQAKSGKGSKRFMSSLKSSVFTFDIALGSFSVVSAIPNKTNISLLFSTKSPALKLISKYRGYTKNRTPNIHTPALEVCGEINHFELVLEPLFLDSVVAFLGTGFSLRKRNKKKSSSNSSSNSSITGSSNGTTMTTSGSGGGSGSSNGSGKSGLSDKLWFISNARVNVCYNGVTITFGEFDKIVQEAFIVHVEKVVLTGSPSTEVVSSYVSEGIDLANKVFDEDASINEFQDEFSSPSSSSSSSSVSSSVDPPSTSSSSTTTNSNYGFNLLALDVLFSNVWFGITKTEETVRFVKPFEIDSEVHVFQPISLICSLLKKNTINDIQKEQEIISEEQLPAISFDLNISTLSINSLQSSVYYSYKYVLPLLKYPKKILNAIKLSTKPTQVKANVSSRSLTSTQPLKSTPESTNTSPSAQKKVKVKKMAKVKKKADMIKRAMEMRLAKSALPFRIFAAGNIEKIQICTECGEDTIGFVLDNVILLGKKKKEDKTAIKRFIEEVLERSLRDELMSPQDAGKMPLTMDFLSTELSFNYSPPMPLKIMDILVLSDSSGLKKLSEKDVTTVEANVNLKDFNISLHPSAKFPIGLSLRPQQQQQQHEHDQEGVAGEPADSDESGDKLVPTDIIFIKYRLEYGDKNSIRKQGASDERRPKHYLFFTFSGIRVVSDGSTNTVIDLIKRITHPADFIPRIAERNFGDDVTVDVKFCDIDFAHEDTATTEKMKGIGNGSSPFLAAVKFLPRSDAGILYLQDRFTYKVTQLRIKHENEMERLQAVLEGARKEIKDLEELLIGAKVSCATMSVNLEESNNALIKAKRECVLKDAKITQLIAEKVALGSMIKSAAAGSGNLASNTEIQNLIKELNDKNIELSSECEQLRVEVSAQRANYLKLKDDKNAHIERLQKAAAEKEKTLIEENERLKKLLAERDAQLEAAQKSLLDRQIVAEKLAQAEKQIAEQQKTVELTLKKSASRKICPTASGLAYSPSIMLSSPQPSSLTSSSSSSTVAMSASLSFDDTVSSNSPIPSSSVPQSSSAVSPRSQHIKESGDSAIEQSSGSSSRGISGSSAASDANMEKRQKRFMRGKSLANIHISHSLLDESDETMTEIPATETKHKKKRSKKTEQEGDEGKGDDDAALEKKSHHHSLKAKSSKRKVSVSDADGPVVTASAKSPKDSLINGLDEPVTADEEDDGAKKKKTKRGFGKFKTQIDTKKTKKKKEKSGDDTD